MTKARYQLSNARKKWVRNVTGISLALLGMSICLTGNVSANDINNNTANQDDNVTLQTQKFTPDDSAILEDNTNTISANSSNFESNDLTEYSVQLNQQNSVENGWQKNTQGQMTYYQDSKPLSGRQYSYLPTIPNTSAQGDHNWYLVDNGVVQSGFQAWAGSHYYFDPSTYLRVDNDYRTIGDGTTGYLLGKDGCALSGVQKWAGTYYYFDPTTYLKQNDVYATSQWGMKYMFGKDGRIVTGLYKWDKNCFSF